MYQYLDAALVRAPMWDARRLTPWPDLTGPDATPAAWRAWLGRAWQIPEFASAVEAASPDLARQSARIRETDSIPGAVVRRAVLSTLRYQLRGAHRPTPFGLLAGIAPARLGGRAAITTGTGHRAIARTDATWLAAVIERLESDQELCPRLTVAANNLVTERDGYLVISHRSGGSAGAVPERMRARATRPVRAVLEGARSPVRVSDLAARLAAGFPAASDEVISGLIARMIGQRLLLTSLRAAMTAADPLAALIAELENVVPAGMRGPAGCGR